MCYNRFGPAAREGHPNGMGPDGHCASLFPHHPGTGVLDRSVIAVHESPKPPPGFKPGAVPPVHVGDRVVPQLPHAKRRRRRHARHHRS